MSLRRIVIAAFTVYAQAQTVGTVAYTHAPEGSPAWPVRDIYVLHEGDPKPQALTSDGHSHTPVWSPDGKRILFIHDAPLSAPPRKEAEEFKSYHQTELSIMDADGRNRRVLRVIEPVIYSAAWSPDGETLAVSLAKSGQPGEPVKHGLYLLPADGVGELRLIVPNAWTPSWSPDGKKLAFTIENPRGSSVIHTANADGTDDRLLTDPAVISGSPSWSPDGKQLAFEQVVDAQGRSQVFLMNADGSGVRQLTNDSLTNSSFWSCGHPAWVAGGRQLIVACRTIALHCGMGVSSTGHPLPECTRRLFAVSAVPGSGEQPVRLIEHDGSQPATQGRTPPPSSRSALQAAVPGRARTEEP